MKKHERTIFISDRIDQQWVRQATRQIDASGGRDIEWYFHEQAAADAAQDLFRQVPICAGSKSIICRIQRAFPTRMRESNDQFANIDNPYDFAAYSIYASWGPRAEPPEAIAPHYSPA